ncbi:hypothetical protein Sjap_002580 [Stephania japonica]|uniref:Uncharacterized protein n=1 Tax=Stephania japonica TaxID=461633 RepID=A0AAP0KPR9_9MAGN
MVGFPRLNAEGSYSGLWISHSRRVRAGMLYSRPEPESLSSRREGRDLLFWMASPRHGLGAHYFRRYGFPTLGRPPYGVDFGASAPDAVEWRREAFVLTTSLAVSHPDAESRVFHTPAHVAVL